MVVDQYPKIAFQKSFSEYIGQIHDASELEKVPLIKELGQLMEAAKRQWILERNYQEICFHESEVYFAIQSRQYLPLFLCGINLSDIVIQKCYDFPKSTSDPFFVRYERIILETLKFVEYTEDWSIRSELFPVMLEHLQSLELFSLPLLSEIVQMFKIFQPSDMSSVYISEYYHLCIGYFKEILLFFNEWHDLLNPYLETILPTLADLIHLNHIDISYYALFNDLPDFDYVNCSIAKVYKEFNVE